MNTLIKNTVNDRFGTLGTYLKAKALGWALAKTGRLIIPRRLLKNKKMVTTKSIWQLNF